MIVQWRGKIMVFLDCKYVLLHVVNQKIYATFLNLSMYQTYKYS